jgi:flagellar hook assembly protein FlgD
VDDIFGLGSPEDLGGGSSAGVGDIGQVADVTRLFPVEPNPFSGSTTVRFSLVREEQVVLRIYDARGMLVKTLEDRLMPSGQHQVVWDGTDNLGRRVAAGVYFTRFAAGAYSATEKTMFLR